MLTLSETVRCFLCALEKVSVPMLKEMEGKPCEEVGRQED